MEPPFSWRIWTINGETFTYSRMPNRVVMKVHRVTEPRVVGVECMCMLVQKGGQERPLWAETRME
jgi:hypothetical protein